MKTITMKEQVLQFVESRGTATYTEIIQFIVDTKFGKDTFSNAKGTDQTWGRNGNKVPANPYRGYFASALSGPTPYFVKGSNRLQKITNPMNPSYGKYTTVRNNEIQISY